jgi:pyruvate/2-oxoglutarate dehydrogenase complex dihydrolipoamide acyltransferase (E2) component
VSEKAGPYHVVNLSAGRRMMAGMNSLYWRTHCMYGLLEVDVTLVRKFIADYRARTGELLSFTGYLTFCLARAVDEDKSVQAHLKGRKQLVVFDDVDVGLMVERKVGDKSALMGHVIRGANRKTFRQIHQEIRSAQSEPVPPDRGVPSWFRSAMMLPWPLAGWFRAWLRLSMRLNPEISVAMGGTVGVTAVGMFGKGQGGWGIVPLHYPLGLIVGSTAWKPAVVEGRIEPREILNLTVVVDHDVIDGAPAARFSQRLVELIESGYRLDADQTE